MTDTPLPNDPASRTETGEILDQAPKTEPTTEGKTEPEAKTDATEPSKDKPSLLNEKKEEPKAGAPEKYEPFTVPEGFTLDEKVSGEASAIFKELGLDQASAQRLVDFYSSKTIEAANAPYELYSKMREGWQTEVRADPEIGTKLPAVKETISRALDSLGDAKLANEFRGAMDLTGAGDHPAFIKAFYKLAQAVTEGKAVTPKGPSVEGQKAPGVGKPTAAQALYPNLPSSA